VSSLSSDLWVTNCVIKENQGRQQYKGIAVYGCLPCV
jgi:hypothetical protein